MEIFAGIAAVVIALGVIWYFVAKRNRYHDEHDRPQTGSGGGNGPPRRTDKV